MPENHPAEKLATYRQKIDAIDGEIVALIAQRFDWARLIRQEKAQLALAITQPLRYEQLVAKWRDEAIKHGLSEDFAAELFQLLHAESTRIQARIEPS